MDGTVALTIYVSVLGVILLLVIVLGILAVFWIIGKLRQHDDDILKLQDLELLIKIPNTTSPTDSAMELDEVDTMVKRRERPSQVSVISHLNGVQARMTVVIQKETANVYGHAPQLGQMLMTAQHYYKLKTNTATDVPAESVQVVDKETNLRSSISRLLTDDWREGVPTSLLFNATTESFSDVFSQHKGIFIHKTIGPTGGRLSISGVSLLIPPNALVENTLISVGVLWDERFQPSLSKKQSMLSPVVLCQPTGLKFKIPVTLTFPHSAVNITSNWNPNVIKREGSLTEQHDWKPITLADYEERDVSDNHISIQLNHFTLYTCTGESKPGKIAAKLVHIVAFAGKLQKGSFFNPRVYCLNKYKDELGEVETLVSKMDAGSTIADTTEIIIKDNDQDVMVEMAKYSDDWNLAGDKTEVLQFEQVWQAYHSHCTFVLKPKQTYVADILCEIQAYQNGDDNNNAKLNIAETMQFLPSSLLPTSEEDPQEKLIQELVIFLDPQNQAGTDAGDWRDLAGLMDCSVSTLRWLGTQSSPTRVLINKWLKEKNTLKDLEQVMIEINRHDIAEEIRKRLSDLEPSPNT